MIKFDDNCDEDGYDNDIEINIEDTTDWDWSDHLKNDWPDVDLDDK